MDVYRLPNELWRHIFGSADQTTLNSVALVSHHFRALSMDAHVTNLVWRDPQTAKQNLTVFWDKFTQKHRSVSSLLVQCPRNALGGTRTYWYRPPDCEFCSHLRETCIERIGQY